MSQVSKKSAKNKKNSKKSIHQNVSNVQIDSLNDQDTILDNIDSSAIEKTDSAQQSPQSLKFTHNLDDSTKDNEALLFMLFIHTLQFSLSSTSIHLCSFNPILLYFLFLKNYDLFDSSYNPDNVAQPEHNSASTQPNDENNNINLQQDSTSHVAEEPTSVTHQDSTHNPDDSSNNDEQILQANQ
ncbi:hypothetical protein AYI70_g9258, partial [Smittium culicis]